MRRVVSMEGDERDPDAEARRLLASPLGRAMADGERGYREAVLHERGAETSIADADGPVRSDQSWLCFGAAGLLAGLGWFWWLRRLN